MFFKLSAGTWYLLSVAAALLIAIACVLVRPCQFTYWMAAGIGMLFYGARKEDDRKPFSILAFGLLLSAVLMPWVNDRIASVTAHTWDATFSRLGAGASIAFFHWVAAHEEIRLLLITVYDSLTFFICTSFLLSEHRRALIRCLLIAALLAPVCYLAFPAVGPGHLADPGAPRNCMPSLHIAWALLAASFITPRLRWIGIPFIVLMLTAVIGTGEHYVIDIVLAVPYSVMVAELEDWMSLSAISLNFLGFGFSQREKV